MTHQTSHDFIVLFILSIGRTGFYFTPDRIFCTLLKASSLLKIPGTHTHAAKENYALPKRFFVLQSGTIGFAIPEEYSCLCTIK